LVVVGALVAVAGIAGLAVSYGSVTVAPGEVWRVVAHHLAPGLVAGVDPTVDQIVWRLRVPRVVLGLVVGAGLAVSGAALQALVRNPLADPYILGVSSGGAFGAVAMTLAGGGLAAGALAVSGGAFAGALGTTLIVFVLARQFGRLEPTRLLLAGVALSYFATSGISFLVFRANDPQAARSVLYWTLGSLSGATFDELTVPAVVCALGVGWLILYARQLDALAGGDQTAISLGVEVERFRLQLLVATSLVVGVLVAVVGAVGFVGLMVPHMVRLVVGASHRRLLPAAALVGALFLVLADLAARMVARPGEMPVGVVTAACGVPFFVVLLRRQGRRDHAGGPA
jgi:iron complex transport system permease protein